MTGSRDVMSLAEVAAVIPTHQRHLRLVLSDPARAPMAPQPLPREGHYIRFHRQAVEAWLRQRDALRERLGKPYLRWCDPAFDVQPLSVAATEAVEEQTEATIALRLRANLVETLGARLSPQEIDKQVLAVMHRTHGPQDFKLA